MTTPAIGKRLRERRKHAGLTQQELADEVGVHRVSVACWESGKHAPDLATVIALARTLSMSLDWLAFGDR